MPLAILEVEASVRRRVDSGAKVGSVPSCRRRRCVSLTAASAAVCANQLEYPRLTIGTTWHPIVAGGLALPASTLVEDELHNSSLHAHVGGWRL